MQTTEMDLVKSRRISQLDILESGVEIEVGDISNLPVSLEIIKGINADSDCVKQVFSTGLTAIVYKIEIDNKLYSLKKKRPEILVKNTDGQTSFLNEIQRRRDFHKAKQREPDKFKGIVDTIYASLRHEFILSEWIESEFITTFFHSILKSIFTTLFEVEKLGLFECDLSLPNLLVDSDNLVHFFDFGYMYPYNPLTHYNSDGVANPIFHLAERLESRCFMQYLMDLEDKNGIESALEAFKIAKIEALDIYTKKLDWLTERRADLAVINWQRNFICLWQAALQDNDLNSLYQLESYRSYVLDVHDDISGESCTQGTIQKVNKIIERVDHYYDFLKANNGMFWGDELLEKQTT